MPGRARWDRARTTPPQAPKAAQQGPNGACGRVQPPRPPPPRRRSLVERRFDGAVEIRSAVVPGEASRPTAVVAALVFVILVGSSLLAVSVVGSDAGSGQVESESLPIEGAPLIKNIYAAAGANMLSPAVAGMPYRVYVPNSEGSSVDVIDPTDPAVAKVIARFPVGLNPQHVVPAWDLQTLYVTNNQGNSLTPVDPRTAAPSGPTIP